MTESQLQFVASPSPIRLPIQRMKRWTLIAAALLLLFMVVPSVNRMLLIDQGAGAAAAERAAAISTTRSWIAAVNQYLVDGSREDLEPLLADEFVDHNPLPGTGKNVDGYLVELAGLRNRLPDLQLHASIAEVNGDIVTVSVRGMVAGLPLQNEELVWGNDGAWTFIERLRIADGKVSERWSEELPFSVPQVEATFASVESPRFALGRVARLELSGGRWFAPRDMAVLVESGEARIVSINGNFIVESGEPSDRSPILHNEVTAEPGDIVYSRHTFVIEVADSAEMLVIDNGAPPTDSSQQIYATQQGTSESTTVIESARGRTSGYSLYQLSGDGKSTISTIAQFDPDQVTHFEHEVTALPLGEILKTGSTGTLKIPNGRTLTDLSVVPVARCNADLICAA